ncbi:MAG TPA: adenosyl-hopene transferase HpnH [Thermodesulfobacteriota bacterium]|nr:adenosyl-hopene transferase HpnH [Thermodesulfobacteriota bacterium]
MGVPLIQQYRVARYLASQKLRRRPRYPLVLMLEPLFRCNLECAGCGKIDYPEEILNRRLSVEECLSASDECGAPIVAISGGEPLIHEEMPLIVSNLIKRKRFVYLCSNGLLLNTRIKDYTPSPYLTLSVHLDGYQERHDALACRQGVFDAATEAIKSACSKGFRVTINCTLYEGIAAREVSDFFDFIMSLGVEGIMVSPAYRYAEAPQKDIFLMKTRSINLFREILNLGKGRKWRFNQSTLFLDFLAGNQAYTCTPWGNPTRNIFGWQRPCYLLTKEGYAPSFKALIEETSWDNYGDGRNPKCANCMLHSGFEPTAVNDAFIHPLKALWVRLRGPRTHGSTIPNRPKPYRDPSAVPIEGRAKNSRKNRS